MVQKIVLKVDASCQKCKKKLLKAVSTLQGVDKIEVDAGKGTLTVTGNADPYEIIVCTRKVAKFAEVVSIGPPPAPPKQDVQKKQDAKKPDQKTQIHNLHSCPCPLCNPMTSVVHVDRYPQSPVSCSIL